MKLKPLPNSFNKLETIEIVQFSYEDNQGNSFDIVQKIKVLVEEDGHN